MSRDLGSFIDLSEMLKNKYDNEEYDGSKVLFYGTEIPDEYKTYLVEQDDMSERRVIEE